MGVYLEKSAIYPDKISTPQVTADDDRMRPSSAAPLKNQRHPYADFSTPQAGSRWR
jgi:hypothetical protein